MSGSRGPPTNEPATESCCDAGGRLVDDRSVAMGDGHDSPAGEDAAAQEPGSAPPPLGLPFRRPLRLIAVAGAKGGVGKTLLAANLGVYLATLGRRVVLVDADGAGANVHTFLGVERADAVAPYLPPGPAFLWTPSADMVPPPAPMEPGPSEPLETPVPGLTLLDAELDRPGATDGASLRRELFGRVRALEADYAVIDLGSGVSDSFLDLWLAADVSLFVTLPEPPAIENTYRFLRASFARHLLREAPDETVEDGIRQRLRSMDGAPAPLDLARRLEAEADPLAGFVRERMEAFPFRLVLNQTRVRADLDLGDRMRSAARRRLGVSMDYLGYVDYDDAVWTAVRARRALLVESPGTKASRSIEKIARRLIAAESGKGPPAHVRNVPPETHHDLLEVERGATDEEIRRAYKRAKEVYGADSLCCYGLFDGAGLAALRARLEEAYDVLLDPARRRPYEISVFPPEPGPEVERAFEDPGDEMRPEPPPITPETEFTGELLRVVRESQGVDVRAISQRTKIGAAYLRGIEEEDFGRLPAPVYVRGFLVELAKFLGLDPEQVARTYVRRYGRYLDDRERL
jgi:flagellar biosynthesis protein FlhG